VWACRSRSFNYDYSLQQIFDDGKWHKLDKKITEELWRRNSEQQVDDEVSSCEEIEVQKKLVKELVDNPKFMTEARREELERRQMQKDESTPVVKEKRNFSLFPHHQYRSEPHATAAIQQPAVVQKQQVQTVSAVLPPPSESFPPSKAMGSPKVIGSPSKPNNAPSNR